MALLAMPQSANIGVTGDLRHAKLLDCGLARSMEGRANADAGTTAALGLRSIATGAIAGTPRYMADEALRKYGAQSEVFSFGLVLLELTSGCLITDDTRDEADAATDCGDNAEGLSKWLDATVGPWPAEVSGPLLQLINECLRSKAQKRPKSMFTVLTRLRELRTAAATSVAETASQRECIVCFGDYAEEEGVCCGEAQHFTCQDCLQVRANQFCT